MHCFQVVMGGLCFLPVSLLAKPLLEVNFQRVYRSCGSPQEPVIRDVVGAINPKSLTLIMGEAGAGKSTLFDTLTGRLEKACIHGQYRIRGHEVLNRPVGSGPPLPYSEVASKMAKKGVDAVMAMVPQSELQALFPILTVEENIRSQARWRCPGVDAEKEVQRLLQVSRLRHRASSYPVVGNGMSGGEVQRLNMALSQVCDRATLLLADEPFSRQDVQTEMVQLLRGYSNSSKATLAIVHQPTDDTFFEADELILMAGRPREGWEADLPSGRVLYWGSTKTVEDHFKSQGFARNAQSDKTIFDYLMRISKCSGFELKACRLLTALSEVRPDFGSIPKPEEIAHTASFFQQARAAFSTTMAIASVDMKSFVALLGAFNLGTQLMRSVTKSNALKIATGAYISNLFTYLVLSYYPCTWMIKQHSVFHARDKPEGFGELAFLTGSLVCVVLIMLIAGVAFNYMTIFIWEVGILSAPVESGARPSHMMYLVFSTLVYWHTGAIVFMCCALWPHESTFVIVMGYHVLFGAFFSGFFPEWMDLSGVPLLKMICCLSPPAYYLCAMIYFEWERLARSYFLPNLDYDQMREMYGIPKYSHLAEEALFIGFFANLMMYMAPLILAIAKCFFW